ncbi:putative ATP-dependent DNA helicase YjcD [Oxobacter pfennigii]|uniref:DNA 3'-5' helicase n=1 Tax=Oxobacter pfennigii TaxID=36849 RepID=A0A0N8NSK3_9CLOT|nr:ATP-dependent helicase [Oxobacter pfennigii]KPU42272.1 putative ATP-dependent DNA helicase YjcD [Oxobacter pfennigii]
MDFFKSIQAKGLHYNNSQQDAITHVEGPLLVVAGPGSGKTSVITARAAHLIYKGITPSNILVITFTRAAANEMKSRFKDFPGITQDHYSKTEFGTFHSTFYKILNSYYGRHLPVLDQKKGFSAVKNILKALNEPVDDEIVQNTINDISIVRTSILTTDFKPQSISLSKLKRVLKEYESFKHSVNCIDFDDMMIMCKKVFETDDKALNFYRQKFKYILIDEFQDTNQIQYEIVKMLSHPLNNLCVVGDDDQSIYSFRGGMPDCLINFKKTFSSCKTVILDINYRSTQEIVDFAAKVIINNSSRMSKNLKSLREEGGSPKISFPQNEDLEGAFVADTIEDLKNKGYSYKDFAVLYRTNIQSRHIIDALIKRGIHFNIKDGLNNFYEHWICRDITCYLKLCINGSDAFSLAQIINRPVRYITREITDRVSYLCAKEGYNVFKAFEACGIKEFQNTKIKELSKNIESLKLMRPPAAVNYIRKIIGYDNYIRNYCMESNIDFEQLFDILDEYESSSAGFLNAYEFLSHIHEMSLKLKESTQNKAFIKDSITLSTVHSAKGLEFSNVFLIGAVEGFFPHKKCIKTGEHIDEERRLFYVAVTRAKNNLFICAPQSRNGAKQAASRFLMEASSNQKEPLRHKSFSLNSGDLISHKIFGTGKIMSVKKDLISVLFYNRKGLKDLDIETCVDNKLIEKS